MWVGRKLNHSIGSNYLWVDETTAAGSFVGIHIFVRRDRARTSDPVRHDAADSHSVARGKVPNRRREADQACRPSRPRRSGS
jgi:hypothetical protein